MAPVSQRRMWMRRPGVRSTSHEKNAPTSCGPSSSQSSPRRMRASKRSEEHTSELQSLMRISYAVFCLKKKTKRKITKKKKYTQINISTTKGLHRQTTCTDTQITTKTRDI